jgi:putative transposase
LRRQRRCREAERCARWSAVAFSRWVRRELRPSETAQRLGVCPAVLGRWDRRWREDQMALRPRGRRTPELDRDTLWGILSVFNLMGPHASVAALQDLFPDVPRGALERTLQRARNIFRRRGHWVIHALRWTRAGTVWAMDFTKPPVPVDGIYNRVLLVRDLASGMQLLALPCRGERSEVVLPALRWLFARFGPPLVLKSDNGPAFISGEVQALLRKFGVLLLPSPPWTPAYNGSVEAGIGSLEVRAFYESARHDRPGFWTSDDLAMATRQANATSRPRGASGPTPVEAWAGRETISVVEREMLRTAYDRHHEDERISRGLPARESCPRWQQASLDRAAIGRALIGQGFLLVRRRRITPPITARKWRRIA